MMSAQIAFKNLKPRIKQAFRAAAGHLLISLAVATIVALLVFKFWFAPPFRELAAGAELFWLIVGVDVVCGPLLTLVVFNPAKSRGELIRDLSLVAVIQLLALGYGVHTLSYARPVALVFEVDRFRLVTFADLDEADAVHTPQWARPWNFSPPRTVGVRKAASPTEMIASIDASLQGVESSQRPSWWQDYSLTASQALQRSRSLSELRAKHPTQTALLAAAASEASADPLAQETGDPNALRWLPLVTRRVTDWVALIDPTTARIRGYIHLDGY